MDIRVLLALVGIYVFWMFLKSKSEGLGGGSTDVIGGILWFLVVICALPAMVRALA